MSLTPGTRLGPYEIVSPLGAGGMGEVYKARDTRLDRTVAIKVLPEALAADPEFRERFDREARVISQLAHPNICSLFDVGRQQGADYLVLEYLEGETLAARIARGALKVDEALRLAIEIASALDAAHRTGIVHRDLKPGNVMLTRTAGSLQAKLLDFGLAKSHPRAVGASLSSMDLTSTPTMTSPLTTQGTILGTFQYMPPEQIEGHEADARSDIWAFGCILHEMVTGRRVFEAKTQAGLIGAILEQQPKMLLELCPSAPRRLGWMVALCLAKDPEERWQHVRDVLHELRCAAADDPPARRSPTTRSRLAMAIAGAAATVAVAVAIVVLSTASDRARAPVRTVVLPAEGTEISGGPASPQAAISPDGTRIVFSAFDANGRMRLYLRPLDALEPRPIDGTEEGELPFWSPDGQSIGFFSNDGKLKKISLNGGSAQTLCNVTGALQPRGGATWNRDGVILFSAGASLSLERVPAAGGVPEAVTSFDSHRARAHMWPAFLADGRRFLFLVTSDDPTVRGIHVGSLGSRETTRLVDTMVGAAFAPPNFVLFVRDGTLLAQPLDADALRLTGEPTPVAERIAYNPAGNLGRAAFTVSDTGVLVYRAGDVSGLAMAQLTWLDRTGAVLGTIGQPGRRRAFDLSPDETRVAVSLFDPRGRQNDIWVVDATGASRTHVTTDPADDVEVKWSPDGERLVFASARRPLISMYVKSVAAATGEQLVVDSPVHNIPTDWSADGRSLIYTAADPKGGSDLWTIPMTGDRTPRPLVRTAADETYAQLSRDGHWLAYTSNESGANEVYVQPFPPSGPQWQVSRNGGSEPHWRGDGHELYYISASQKLMAVEVKTGATFESRAPVELFQMPGRNVGEANGYAVSRDGRRFVVDRVVEQTGVAITVVVDWQQRLK
jgi:eukaryotic-like serine/threonine-protein kinase